MNAPILLKPARIGVYGFALAIAHLAGVYLGGALLVIWYTLLLIPILSLIQALVTRTTLRYHQEFTNDHPSKGEAVGYKLAISNESWLGSSPIVASFYAGLEEYGTNNQSIYLRAHETRRVDQTVRCPYRGIYTVGLSRLAVWDVFGWIGFSLPVFSRTFYVYPRVLQLPTAFSGFGTEHAVAQSPTPGVEIDFTLFRSLRRYRFGDDARHVSWRKLALVGEPLIREYDSAAEPAITICMDSRPVTGRKDVALEVEDCLIETSIALAKYYLEREVPVAIIVGGQVVRLDPGDRAAFAQFHSSTITFFFRTAVPPVTLYEVHRSDTASVEGTVIFVTHSLDPAVIDLVEQSDGRSTHAAAILNSGALTASERLQAETIKSAINDRGGELLVVDSADTLVQEFAQWHAGV